MNRELNSRKREGKDFRREVAKWHGDIPIRNIGEKIHIRCGRFRFCQKEIPIHITGGKKRKKKFIEWVVKICSYIYLMPSMFSAK